MRPFYADDWLTLYLGDALTVLRELPASSVDAVLTDPPYNSGAATLAAKQAEPAKKYQQTATRKSYPAMLGDGRDQRSFALWVTLWLTECWRVARDAAPLLVFTDWRQLPALTDAVQAAGWQWRGIVVWRKPSARPLRGEFRRDTEFIVYARKNRRGQVGTQCLPGVYTYAVNPAQKLHLTGKPLPLIMDLMEIVPLGGTVLDPFLGGGTTAAAAKSAGRTCVGCELSPEYAAITRERIQATTAQPDASPVRPD